MYVCPYCGQYNLADAKVCKRCRAAVKQETSEPDVPVKEYVMKNKRTAKESENHGA